MLSLIEMATGSISNFFLLEHLGLARALLDLPLKYGQANKKVVVPMIRIGRGEDVM